MTIETKSFLEKKKVHLPGCRLVVYLFYPVFICLPFLVIVLVSIEGCLFLASEALVCVRFSLFVDGLAASSAAFCFEISVKRSDWRHNF